MTGRTRRAPKARSPAPRAPVDLRLALSPYHLATREPPAMLALALGSSVVTLLPKPAAGTSRESVREAVDRAPRYLRLMESWRWSGPLWDAGVIGSAIDNEDCATELAGVYEAIRSREELAPLRPLTRGADQEHEARPYQALDAMAGDLLRGGPNPGINIPITAALDRFALRHGLCVVRGATASVAQRAEASLGRRVLGFGLPMLTRAGGARLLRMRNDLAGPLEGLRRAIEQVCGVIIEGAEPSRGLGEPAITACADFARAFELWAPENARGDDENQQRVTSGYLGVSLVVIPGDSALRSSRAAVRAMGGAGRVGGAGGGTSEASVGPCPDRLFALVVREMNVRPEGTAGHASP